MNDFTRGYMRGYKDAQKEALSAQPAEGKDTRSSAATPCRAWVGLTDEDKQKIMWTFTEPTGLFKHFKYMEAVEAKLKAKNERLEKNNDSR